MAEVTTAVRSASVPSPVPSPVVIADADDRDHTADLLLGGYAGLPALRGDADAVRTRFLARPALLVGGPQGVRLFYDTSRMTRVGAIPAVVRKVLFGDGAVQTLDGEEHLTRKRLLMSVVSPESVGGMARDARSLWEAAVDRWGGADRVVVFDEAVRVLGVAALRWAGVPVSPRDTPTRVRDLLAIVDGFGNAPAAHARAAVAHRRAGRWARSLIEQVRDGRLQPEAGTALAALAGARDAAGRPVDSWAAGLDLLNLVRPTVAVAWHVTYAAIALHEHPQWRARIAEAAPGPSSDAEAEAFAHEVRRFYPFVPALAARTRTAVEWHGEVIPQGRLVLLDVHGTNHDPRFWQHADHFYPHRFTGTTPAGLPAGDFDPDAFVPNGGGDAWTTHRCAGEGIMTALLSDAIRVLAGLDYDLPEQNLQISLRRMPPRPGDGFVMTHVRRSLPEGPSPA